MICPLRNLAKLLNPLMHKLYTDDCALGDCAWWDTREKLCCIKTLSKLIVSGVVTTHPG